MTLLGWRSIRSCNNPALAITTDDSNIGSQISTKHFAGANNQLWNLDSDGRLVNKATGLVIEASGGLTITMQQPTPLTGSKQWKYTNDIRSSGETAEYTVPKIVMEGTTSCLQTADRNLPQGSVIILYDAKAVNPGNACWFFS